MNKTKLCLWVVLIFNFFNLSAQDQNLLPNVFPLSPNAGSLAKFGDIPVNHFTGVPDISIPIYEITSGDIKIPITLRYHSSGIRVTDVASWVGLGWALDAGGTITRRTMGMDDEMNQKGYLRGHLQESYLDVDPYTEDGLDHIRAVREGFIDTEPDIFSFNIIGKNGKFFFDGQNNYAIRQIPYSPVRIISNLIDDVLSFNLTDDNGLNYIFNTREATNYEDMRSSTTAFLVDTIISQNLADTVRFNYNTQDVTMPTQYSYSVVVDDDVDDICLTPRFSFNQGTSTNTGYSSTVSEKRLTEIHYKNGKIIFVPSSTSRTDLSGSKSLSEIQIFNYDYSRGDYVLAKKVLFHYGSLSGRLGLDSLSIYNEDNILSERYRFDYNTEVNLPNYNSLAQDYWGYYNGDTSNLSLVPETEIPFRWATGESTITISDNNTRECDSIYMMANILERIYYPSGGFTDFEYESNRYIDAESNLKLAGGLRIKSIKSYKSASSTPIVKTYEYGEGRNNFILDNFYYTTEQTIRFIEQCAACATKRQRVFSSSPSNDIVGWDGAIVVYPNITEYIGDGVSNAGKIVYNYRDRNDGTNSTELVSTKPRHDSYFYARGQILNKTSYANVNGRFQPVVREEYNYDVNDFENTFYTNIGFTSQKEIITITLFANDAFCEVYDPYSGCAYDSESYLFTFYAIQTDDNYLISKVEKTFDNLDSSKFFSKITNYDYQNINHQQINKIVTIDSEGDTLTVLNKYAADYIPTGNSQTNNNILDGMINSNMQSSLVETYTKRGDNIISSQLNLYKLNGPNNTIVQDTIKILSIENPSQDFDTTYLNVQHEIKYDSNYETYVNFDYYNNNNLKQYTARNSPVISVLWGYNNQYPVAKILNSKADIIAYSGFETNTDKGGWTYTGNPVYSNESFTGKGAYQLSGNITKSISDTGKYILQVWAKSPVSVSGATSTDLFSSSANAEGWRYFEKEIHITSPSSTVSISGNTLIDELRLFPGDAQMITYTYEPNIGISSQSDENNIPSFYEYDSFGRLKYIKDQDRNILGKYDYHYQSNQ